MTKDSYRLAIADLEQQRAEHVAEDDRRARVLAQMDAALAGMKALVGGDDYEGSMADAIRTVLKAAEFALTPMDVRDRLKSLGYDLEKHTNPMAAVHGVLKRLRENNEINAAEATERGWVYWWGTGPLLPKPVPISKAAPPLGHRAGNRGGPGYVFSSTSILEAVAAAKRMVDQGLPSQKQMDDIAVAAKKINELAATLDLLVNKKGTK